MVSKKCEGNSRRLSAQVADVDKHKISKVVMNNVQ